MLSSKNPVKNQSGQGLIEYLILVAILAVGTMAAVRLIGQSLNVKFAKVAQSLGADINGTLATPKASASSFNKKDLRNFMSGSVQRKSSSESDADAD